LMSVPEKQPSKHLLASVNMGSGTKPLARQWRWLLMLRIVPDVAHFAN